MSIRNLFQEASGKCNHPQDSKLVTTADRDFGTEAAFFQENGFALVKRILDPETHYLTLEPCGEPWKRVEKLDSETHGKIGLKNST